MKYLIVGLGNVGSEYDGTRHNTGFMLADAFVGRHCGTFSTQRYGDVAEVSLRGHKLFVLKPGTYMNLSGNAVRFWMQKENIPIENILILVDDLALPFGAVRLKQKGSAAGHNGLKNIEQMLQSDAYARVRFGLGSDYPKGRQIDFVLSRFSTEQQQLLPDRITLVCDLIETFCLSGVQVAMNQFNNK